METVLSVKMLVLNTQLIVLGLETVKAELEKRLGWSLDEAKPLSF